MPRDAGLKLRPSPRLYPITWFHILAPRLRAPAPFGKFNFTSPMTPRFTFTHPVSWHVLRPSSASDNSQPLAAKGLLYAN
jgi:hypothetical protein